MKKTFKILQYLVRYSSTVQLLTHGLALSEQARRVLTGGGREVGDGRAEGMSAIGASEQAAISLTDDIDGAGSGYLLDSILSTIL